ncbi:MAG TPA: ribonuclease HI family protein [candidate division WOR-3 bacterium]|uniref:Ribonuclease HI family protein n=1 Tax=candidate division WOR-3 bacterium TaxID=2052148 RepID=A0A9C9END5_UNCW3|nr:ribonuclease HI family protein [candidate division WOR-3 bacterium]
MSRKKYVERIEIYCDGCCKGNPGPSGAGIVVVYDGEILFKEGHYLGDEHTNQDAEYLAVLKGLEKAPEYCMKTIEIRSDSQLVIKQLNRQFRMRKKKHQRIHEQIRLKAQIFEKVIYTKVSEKHKFIKLADKLAHKAIDRVKRGVT